jgi:hypothetical protein
MDLSGYFKRKSLTSAIAKLTDLANGDLAAQCLAKWQILR